MEVEQHNDGVDFISFVAPKQKCFEVFNLHTHLQPPLEGLRRLDLGKIDIAGNSFTIEYVGKPVGFPGDTCFRIRYDPDHCDSNLDTFENTDCVLVFRVSLFKWMHTENRFAVLPFRDLKTLVPGAFLTRRHGRRRFYVLQGYFNEEDFGAGSHLRAVVKVRLRNPFGINYMDAPFSRSSSSGMSSDFTALLKSGNLTDTEFHIGPSQKVFHAHRLVLGCRSPVFRAMFDPTSGFKEASGETTKVVLDDVSISAFDRFLRYLYGDMTSIDFPPPKKVLPIHDSEDQASGSDSPHRKKLKTLVDQIESDNVSLEGLVIDVLALANKYDVQTLLDDLEQRILLRLSHRSAARYLYHANMYGCKSLEHSLCQWAMSSKQNLRKMKDSPFWSKLSKESVLVLLDTHCQEDDGLGSDCDLAGWGSVADSDDEFADAEDF